ncbi:MAG: trimethylamine methyltransferase family protein [Actinobacteria bacterium]|nr:trimethylamine methyltransferase family protein [Actinomycetota bacterium]
MRKGFTRKIAPLKVLSDTQLEYIHSATLEVLEKTGVKLESERALKILKENGCIIDMDEKIARFPGWLVEESARKTPSSFSVKARIPEDDLRISLSSLYFMPAAGAKLHDEKTGRLSVATLQENDDGVRICDGLEAVDFQASYCPFFELKGIEPVMLLAESQASIARNSTRVSRGAQATDSFIWEARIANAAGKQLIGTMEGAAPLCFPEDAINAAFEYMDNGFPIWATGGSVMGGSSPVTVAGATVSNNAEILAAITFIQCYRPGHPVLANDFVIPMDMESGNLFFGAIGSGYHQMAFNQIYRDMYRIPVSNAMAAFPNSKMIDYQNAFEKTHLALSAALSGASMIAFIGSVSQELAWSPVQAVIDNDAVNIIGRYIEGFEVNELTTAAALIAEVGPSPGSFLGKKHTRENWKKEYYVPKTFDRLSYQDWERSGMLSVIDKARTNVKGLLQNHNPSPLSNEQEKEIRKILSDARNYYSKKGLLG